jgi:hypothetical protein
MSTKPVACTLTSADLGRRRERWRELGARALLERVETDRGLRISYRPDPDVEEELHALVAVESECCSWADWRVEAGEGRVALVVDSAGEGIAALHAMFNM